MTAPRTAITGGTGFIGRHLAERLGSEASVIISRRTGEALARAFEGCEVVAHCAGINREISGQTYHRVHIEGSANVIEAAKRAGVRKVIMLSFLRSRPDCGSPYHESKWAAGADPRLGPRPRPSRRPRCPCSPRA
jgi:NADH dehydrogenase